MPSEGEVIRAAMKEHPEAFRKLREMAKAGKLGTFQDLRPSQPLTVVAATEHSGITGSIQARCGCGAAVWLSPSTQAMIKARDAAPISRATTVICVLCFGKVMKETKEQREAQRPQ